MSEPLLPVAHWVNALVAPALSQGAPALDWLGTVLGLFGESAQALLAGLPAPLLILLLAGLGTWRRGWQLGVLVAVALSTVYGMGFGEQLVATLAQVVAASVLTVLGGIPLGVLLGSHPLAARLARPLLDFMQTMPAFVYLIPAVMLFGLGLAPALLATVIFALPPLVRLTALGIEQVERDVQEAASTLGASRWQVLFDVKLPYALPAIMAGVSQAIMMALSMVIIASMVGAGGLGSEVLSAIQRLDIGQGVAAGLSIVLLATVVDRLAQSLAPRHGAPS